MEPPPTPLLAWGAVPCSCGVAGLLVGLADARGADAAHECPGFRRKEWLLGGADPCGQGRDRRVVRGVGAEIPADCLSLAESTLVVEAVGLAEPLGRRIVVQPGSLLSRECPAARGRFGGFAVAAERDGRSYRSRDGDNNSSPDQGPASTAAGSRGGGGLVHNLACRGQRGGRYSWRRRLGRSGGWPRHDEHVLVPVEAHVSTWPASRRESICHCSSASAAARRLAASSRAWDAV